MKSLRDHESVSQSGSTDTDEENGEGWFGVIGNERLTALAGSVLLVLIVVELVTVANLRTGLAVHVLIGVLAAILVLPVAAPWITWITTTGNVPGPFLIIAGLLVTALALLAAKLLRWG